MVQQIELDELIDATGDAYALNNGRTRAVLSETGGGLPPITYIASSGPFQDGQTLRGYRLQPRAYILLVRWQGCSREEYWRLRAKLLDRVRPNRQTIGTLNPYRLRKRYLQGDALQVRDLYVMPAQGPEFIGRNPQQWDEWGFSETIRFIAHDPTWYDGDTTSVAVTPTTTDNLVFPFTAPFIFGSGVISHSEAVTYAGTWAAYPTITIDGPVNGPQITNVTTGEALKFSYNVVAGEQVTIDLGAKTVVNNFGANLIGYLTADSDLATWHLEPAPGAAGGINTISFAGFGATGATLFTISYQNRFIGL